MNVRLNQAVIAVAQQAVAPVRSAVFLLPPEKCCCPAWRPPQVHEGPLAGPDTDLGKGWVPYAAACTPDSAY